MMFLKGGVTVKKETMGIGGWLILLIAWMVVFRPLAGCILWHDMHAATDKDPTLLENSTFLVNTSVFWVIFLCLSALNIYGGLRLWRDRTPASIEAAVLVLWITSPVAGLVVSIHRAYMSGRVNAFYVIFNLGLNLAVAAAWTLYLKRSKRVRCIYTDEPLPSGSGKPA